MNTFYSHIFQIIFLYLLIFITSNAIKLDGPSIEGNGTLISSQYSALKEFYDALDGKNWDWRNLTDGVPWNFSDPNSDPCSDDWQGLHCNCSFTVCSITQIVLPDHNLTGQLPESIQNFTSLAYLSLGRNNIDGSIPYALYFLSQLSHLDFSLNSFTGTISSNISQLTRLQHLDFEANHFIGEIPESLYHLSFLTFLNLKINSLEGTISAQIGLLAALKECYLSLNLLHGSLPSTLGNLKNMTRFDVLNNRFNGTIPNTIGQLKSLNNLILSENFFSGPIPTTIGDLSNLSFIDVSMNRLTNLPDSIGNLTKLIYLGIDNNLIEGTIPAALSNLTALRSMLASHNKFYGSFPSSLFNPTKRYSMVWFTMSENLLTGKLPVSLTALESLENLELSYNSLVGTIPNNYNNFTSLLEIVLNSNFLIGNFDSLFQYNVHSLQTLQLAHNSFTGSLPVGNWLAIKFYLVYNNYFSGTIPVLFQQTLALYYFDLSENYLFGNFPPYLSQLDKLTFLNLSVNMLTGPVIYNNMNGSAKSTLQQVAMSYNFLTGALPANLGYVVSITYLILNNNQFNGKLPLSWGYLSNLEICFLQNNQITGPLYPYLAPTMTNLDVSNNLFTGTFPTFSLIDSVIETFAASTNCFTGTIPSDICDCKQLTFLAMDGLATAESCRNYIFPKGSFLTGFYVTTYFNRGIPSCLFAMPMLQTLHLSGNGLTGTLPSNANLSISLNDLSLSHNQLTGTIPLLIQERKWKNLDLSYNKLTGTLSAGFNSYDNESSLSLQINRLSGDIPSVLFSADNIDILQGNMFACDPDHNDLPHNDAKFNEYSCGSDIVNATLYSWIGIIFAYTLAACALYWNCIKQYLSKWIFRSKRPDSTAILTESSDGSVTSKRSIVAMKELAASPTDMNDAQQQIASLKDMSLLEFVNRILFYQQYFTQLADVEYPSSYLCGLAHYLSTLRKLIRSITAIIVLILLPVFVGISFYYSFYNNEYAWILSGVLLSGRTPALVMLSLLMCLLWIFIASLRAFVSLNRNYFKNIKQFRRTSVTSTEKFTKSLFTPPSILQSPSITNPLTRSTNYPPSQVRIQEQELVEEEKKESKSSIAVATTNSAQTSTVNNNKETNRQTSILSIILPPSSPSTQPQQQQPQRSDEPAPESVKDYREFLLKLTVFLLIAFMDCVIMILADIFYVYILLTYPTGIIIISEVCLAVFKLALNNKWIWISIPFLRQRLYPCIFSDKDLSSLGGDEFRLSLNSHYGDEEQSYGIRYEYFTHYDYSSFDISFITFLILLNNLFFPIVAILIVSPECFFNALFAADAITSDYLYDICDRTTFVEGACLRSVMLTEQSSYSPPYIPNYECASALVINYSPVFVIMFIFEGILSPSLKLLLQWYYFRLRQLQTAAMSRADAENPTGNSSVSGGGGSSVIGRRTMEPVERDRSTLGGIGRIPRKELHNRRSILFWLNHCLPDNLKELVPHHPKTINKNLQYYAIFNKNRLAVRISAYLVIMASFGALFPPLALVACCTIITVTLYEEVVIGRLLHEAEQLGYNWYKRQLERDCYGIAESLEYTLWSLVPVSSVLFAYLVFDIWADETGWEPALPGSLVMLCLPILSLLLVGYLAKYWNYWNNRFSFSQTFVGPVSFMQRDLSSVFMIPNYRPTVAAAASNNTVRNPAHQRGIQQQEIANPPPSSPDFAIDRITSIENPIP